VAQKYCKLCERNVEAGGQIGIGSLLLVLLTAGFWILLIPFYESRCNICKSTELIKPKRTLIKPKKASRLQNNKYSSKNISVADEIVKLRKLKEEGIITDTEFEEQKKTLLS